MERRRREGDDEEEEEEVGGGLFLQKKVRGQIIKSVRLLATSSNLKELINAGSQACGFANQVSNQCLAMPMPSSEWQERESERKKDSEWGGKERGRVMNRRVG